MMTRLTLSAGAAWMSSSSRLVSRKWPRWFVATLHKPDQHALCNLLCHLLSVLTDIRIQHHAAGQGCTSLTPVW